MDQGTMRNIMVYGNFLEPTMQQNFIVLRIPEKGTRWRALMQAAKKLTQPWFPVGTKARDRRWNVDGEATGQDLWATKIAARYEWNGAEFVRVT